MAKDKEYGSEEYGSEESSSGEYGSSGSGYDETNDGSMIAQQSTQTASSRALPIEHGSRQALRQQLEENPNATLVAATVKFPMAKNRNTQRRRVRYGTDSLEMITVDLPRTATMHEIVFGFGDSVHCEVSELDVNGGESNHIRLEFTHETNDKEIEVDTEVRGVKVLGLREVSDLSEVDRLVGSMLPAGATGQPITDPENNPLGGDGTLEGTKVGRRPPVPPNPNIQTGVGTTIGSPPGTGTA